MVWVIGLFGTMTMAAHIYAFRYMMVAFMPAVGIGSAVTALVGRYIGKGQPELAKRRAHLGFVMSAIYMVSVGVLMIVFRHELIGMFTSDPQIIRIGSACLVMMAIYQIFDAMYVVYNGALRGAGDTLVPAIVLAGLVWVVGVGGGYLAAKSRPDLGVVAPWAVMTVYGAILGLFLLTRFNAGRWRSIQLHPKSRPTPDDVDVTTESAKVATVS
jgi:MATE family multidrug resistance protein